jgi:hypothetical protein
MQQDSNLLIDDLLALTEISTQRVKQFKSLSPEQLNFRTNHDQWSILQCLEHLNLYGDFYLPEIEKQILKHKHNGAGIIFKSGMIGNYFANLMKATNGRIKKMKSPKDKVPSHSDLTVTTIDRFLKQQELLKTLLNQARSVNLTRTKVPISLTRFIRLRLGDTFRFYIYHIERHVAQAERAELSAISVQLGTHVGLSMRGK